MGKERLQAPTYCSQRNTFDRKSLWQNRRALMDYRHRSIATTKVLRRECIELNPNAPSKNAKSVSYKYKFALLRFHKIKR